MVESSNEKIQSGRAEQSFESSLAELEELVSLLEAGEKPLDESLALYERGVAALKRCHVILDQAEKRIRLLVKSADGEPVLRDAEMPEAPRAKPKKSGGQNVDAPGGVRQNPPASASAQSRPKAEEPGTGGPLFGSTE